MESFLSEVARDLYGKYGSEVGDWQLLFPSRRARLFFADELKKLSQHPIWEPQATSIDEIMSHIAGIRVGERVRLIAELFKVYSKYHKDIDFDKFYFWGEILLSDFDMIDKYRIDADMLLRNVTDIKEIEADLSYLTPEQINIIKKFWSTLEWSDDPTSDDCKGRFLKVWSTLLPIYHEFRAALKECGLAYTGMVHREAVDKIINNEFSFESDARYVIAGFNALSECEKELFKAIKTQAQSCFYWDWDSYYVDGDQQEAGLFLRNNKMLFPPAAEISHNNFARDKNMEVVACSSSALQCKYVGQIIDDIIASGGVIDKRTAIVLTDESLLLPLLYALPKSVDKVNVTMGYPLRQTLAYSFVERLIELQNNARVSSSTGGEQFYHTNVKGILAHPYLETEIEVETLREIEKMIDKERLISVPAEQLHRNELLSLIFKRVLSWGDISQYLISILSRVATLLHKSGDSAMEQQIEFVNFLAENISMLHNSLTQCEVEIKRSTYISLLRRHLQSLRIPYEGEPLEGLQVMGILETRNIDFDRVIILSMNDDNFPGDRTIQSSYIPYNLRAAYNLPTPEHHDGVFAYYFYRLMQRTESVHMLYCSRADDKSTGEQSRYITQLDFESPFNLSRIDVGVDVNLFESDEIVVEKSGEVANQLREFISGKRRLSPTALYRFIECPLKFYYNSVAYLRRDDELTEEVDAPMFGNILHHAMEVLYRKFVGVSNLDVALGTISDAAIERAIDEAIAKKYLCLKSSENMELTGSLLIVREVVRNYIRDGVIKYDKKNPQFMIEGVEMEVTHKITLPNGAKVTLFGLCDRIDMLDRGRLRVVDYKSGSPHLVFGGFDGLFGCVGNEPQGNIFQTLLYSYMLHESRNDHPDITPSLFYVRSMNSDDFSPYLIDKEHDDELLISYNTLHEEFSQRLIETLEVLFDERIPFTQCDISKEICGYCDYKNLCRRSTD